MLNAASDAIRSMRGKTFDDLDIQNDFTLALIKRLEIIGEAASRVSAATRAELPGIPWQDVVDTRHRLVHGYAEIDLAIVWNIATQELPLLEASLKAVLGSTSS